VAGLDGEARDFIEYFKWLGVARRPRRLAEVRYGADLNEVYSSIKWPIRFDDDHELFSQSGVPSDMARLEKVRGIQALREILASAPPRSFSLGLP
jgi:hypothetical protein